LAGVVFAKGVTTVTWTASDGVTTVVTCSFTVTVTDNQQPVITCPVTGNANRNTDNGECTYTVQGTEFDAAATDNCGVTSLTYTLTGATTGSGTSLAGVVFAKGVTTVTWTASDGVTTVVTCSFTVTVTDNQQPVITCPVSVNANRNTDNGVCTYTVQGTEFDATATDNCAATLSYVLTGATTGSGTSLAAVVFGKGVTTVTWTASDGVTTVVTCSFTVTVTDNQQPVITCPVSVNANRNTDNGVCTYTVQGTEFDATATDNCAATLSYVLSGATTGSGTSLTGVVFGKGVTTVTWTASDGVTTDVTCSFTVTVQDNEKPTITCQPDITVAAPSGACNTMVTVTPPTVSDNCGFVQLLTPVRDDGASMSDPYPIGVTKIFWKAVDAAFNDNDCMQTVTVTGDVVVTIQCPPTVTRNTDAGHCYATIPVADLGTASLLTGCNVVGFTYQRSDGLPFSAVYPVGTTIVTWNAVNEFGEVLKSCAQEVVVTDNVNPTITLPVVAPDYNADNGLCQASLSFTATATDNCGIDHISYYINYNTPGQTQISFPYNFPVGTTTVTVEATDIHNNVSTSTFDVTVVDNQAPVLDNINITSSSLDQSNLDQCLSAATGFDAHTLEAAVAALYKDNCGTVTASLSGTTAGVSNSDCSWTFTYHFTVTDLHGNSVTCDVVYSGGDKTAPVITTTAGSLDATLECSDASGIAAALAAVPLATDNCATTPAIHLIEDITTADPNCANAYVRVRTWNFTDGCGNTSLNFVQTIRVQDHTAPVITTTAGSLDATLECSDASGLTAALAAAPVATDNCTTTPTMNLVSDVTTPDANCANAYVRVRTWNFTDGCGNTSLNFVQTITVQDHTAPVITTTAGSLDATLECSNASGIAAALAAAPVATDNCTTTPTIHLVSDVTTPDPNCANAYIRVRTWNFTDGCGNTSLNFVQTITVQDNTAPVITCPATGNINRNTTVACTYVASNGEFNATAIDNCGTVTLSYTLSGATTGSGSSLDGVAFNIGSTTVTWTATDACNNTSTCSFTVTVVDNVPPTITCQPDMTVAAPSGACNTMVTVTPPAVSDNCSNGLIPLASRSDGATMNDPFPVGVTQITWTVTDAANNQSQCVQTITVTGDVVVTIQCAPRVTRNTDAGHCYATIPVADLGTASLLTGCNVVGFTFQRSDGLPFSAVYPVGTTTITWNAVNEFGDILKSCAQQVIVTDNVNPVITLPSVAASYNADNGLCQASLSFTATATDICGVDHISYYINYNTPGQTQISFPYNFPVGTTTVTVEATDIHNNVSTSTFDVTVVDNQVPVLNNVNTTSSSLNQSNLNQCLSAATGFDAHTLEAAVAALYKDNCGTVTASLSGSTAGVSNSDCSWTITYHFNVTDIHNNSVSCDVVYSGGDKTAPTLTGTLPSGQTGINACLSVAPVGPTESAIAALYTDNCGTVNVTKTGAPTGTNCNWTATYTYHITDGCGNAVANDVVITYSGGDHTLPTITCPSFTGNNASRTSNAPNCTYIPSNGEFNASATDNCGAATLSYTLSGATTGSGNNLNGVAFNVGVTTVTWTATDGCSNSSTCSFTVTVAGGSGDLSITCPPAISVNAIPFFCYGLVLNLGTPQTTAGCSPIVSVTNDHSSSIYPVGT
ncbi:MAG: HYR domain-containing protein, partial [Bacteroidetes bacterium]|nr:HYR domain-containing protein [Bacteroidota bacterium]